MQKFMKDNELVEVHKHLNSMHGIEREPTHWKGRLQIDAILIINGLVEEIQWWKLINFYKVINTDYRGFIIIINIKQYFAINSSEYSKIDST